MALVVYWPQLRGAPALPTLTPQAQDAQVHQLRGFRFDASTFCVVGFHHDSEGDVIGDFHWAAAELDAASWRRKGSDFIVAAVRRYGAARVPVVALCAAEEAVELRRRRCKVVFYDIELAAGGVLALERQRTLTAASLVQATSVSRSPFAHAPDLLDQLGQRHVQHARQVSSEQQHSVSTGQAAMKDRAVVVVETVAVGAAYAPCAMLTALSVALDAVVARLHAPRWLPLVGGKSAEDGSQFLALANRRLAGIASWPKRVRHYYQLSKSRPLTFQEKLETLQLVDFVLMVAVDVAVGFFLLSLASRWAWALGEGSLSHTIMSAPLHFLRLLRVNVTWLMGAPAGFKLNRPLATIVGNGVLLWLDVWEFCFSSALPLVTGSGGGVASPSKVLLLRGLWVGLHVMGVTLQLSLLADAVAVYTWSSSWVYQYFAKLNRLQRGLFSSLWNLFLGKKKNVLRRRVDSQEYDISQLLLGTLLFTILVFMVTTTMVFFVFFFLARAGVFVCLALLKAPVVGLHALPFATLAVRVCHPSFFSTGMRLEPLLLRVQDDRARTQVVEVTIKSVGVGTSATEDRQHRRVIREALSTLVADDDGADSIVTNVASVVDATECAYFQLKTIAASPGSLLTRLRRYFAKSPTPPDSLSILCDLPPFLWSRIGEADAGDRPKQD